MPELSPSIAALGLGGNIGDPVHAMAEALRALDRHADCRVVAVSPVYRTPPWGKTDQADFFNAAALVETWLVPEALLDLCLSIERDMKRVRSERWGPRTIDIDVLTYAGQTHETERLTLPHPRMTERAFVLMPLADIAGDLAVHGRSIAEWLAESDRTGIAADDQPADWWTKK